MKSLFTKKGALKKHIECVHEGSKPYFCDLCGSAYTNSQALVKHKVERHNLLLYKCSLCPEEFPQKKYLIEHLVKCHEGRVSVQGVESLWGDCRFVLADWGS